MNSTNTLIAKRNKNKNVKSPLIQIQKTVQTANSLFDPETSTPPSDFMETLKARMNVYFPVNVK